MTLVRITVGSLIKQIDALIWDRTSTVKSAMCILTCEMRAQR